MDTKTVLVLAAVAVGGVVLYTKLKPGFSAPPSAPIYAQPSPTAPPTGGSSRLDQILNGINQGTQIVKSAESIWDTVKGWG
jgi:hypothetical protein